MKIRLVYGMDTSIVEKNGVFISGKYERLKRDIPYSAIIQALTGLVQGILKESPDSIRTWKDIILSAISPNGRIITDAIPELSLVIGEQPPAPELNSEESRNRFNHVYSMFIRAVSRVDRPVVLFLDDLQWADLSSLDLIERLLINPEIRYLMLIGSYRDSEVRSSDPFMHMLVRIDGQGVTVKTLALKPLMEFDIRNLISDAMGCSHEQADKLAVLVYRKTGGNPFFVNRFLIHLFEENIIRYDTDKGWHWDNVALLAMQVSDNLADFLIKKIETLGTDAQEILMACACIGSRFDLDMLARVLAKPIDGILSPVSLLIHEGLIIKTSRVYMFVHDRVQEAAYAMIPESRKNELHYMVGRMEWLRSNTDEQQKKLFYIADQCRAGWAHINRPDEVREGLRLFLRAARKARHSAAYDSAALYCRTGLKLLREDSWENDYEITYELHREMLECLYLTGHFKKAEALYQLTLDKATSAVDIANISSVMINLYISEGVYGKALDIGLKASRDIGHPIPEKTGVFKLFTALVRLWWILRKYRIEDIPNIPDTEDPAVKAYAFLLANTGTVIYYSDPKLFALTAIECNLITVKHGKWEHSDLGLVGLACIMGSSLGRYSLGKRLGRAALDLCDMKRGKTNRCRVTLVYAMIIHHWTHHARSSLDYLTKAYTLSLECGDIQYGCSSINVWVMHRFVVGDPLDEIMDELIPFESFIHSSKDPFSISVFKENTRIILCLKGETPEFGRLDGDGFSEKESLDVYTRGNNALGLFYLRCALLKIRFLFGRYEEAMAMGRELDKLTALNVGIGCLYNCDHVFYQALTLTALYPRAPFLKKRLYMSHIQKNARKLKTWAKFCPENFLHAHLLVTAEIERLKNHPVKAVVLYRKAAHAASDSGYLAHEALVYERLGHNFVLDRVNDLAGYYLGEACRCYERLNAKALIDHILDTYPGRVPPHALPMATRPPETRQDLDLVTVIKASQAISGEIQLDNLLTTLLRNTMENAGAGRGFLILESEGRLMVETEDVIGARAPLPRKPIPLENHEGLCRGIVNHTARFQKPLLLSHAAKTGEFTRDPYILKHQTKSVLCLPVLNQGRLSAILYFENNLTSNAFKPDRIDLLRILSAQAAIAIENARLYEKLEEKVRQRTRELDLSLRTVENANRRTMDSLRYSSLIQQALLPEPTHVSACLPKSFIIWQPREIIGGDIYFLEPVEHGFVLALIDCTGHGVPGAFMTVLAITGLRQIIHERGETNPSIILKKLNAFVKNSLGPHRSGPFADDGLDAAVCLYDDKEKQLDFAGARLPLYRIVGDKLKVIKGDRESLGYMSSDLGFDFTQHPIPLAGTTTFYLATDGFADQLGGPKNRRFGTSRFKELLISSHTLSFDEQKQFLLKAINRYKGSKPLTDDITVVGFSL